MEVTYFFFFDIREYRGAKGGGGKNMTSTGVLLWSNRHLHRVSRFSGFAGESKRKPGYHGKAD